MGTGAGLEWGFAMGVESALLLRAFEATSYAVTITDTKARIVAVNPAFTEITGWTAEEAIGQNPRFLQSGRQDAEFYRKMWHDLQTRGQWEGEIWNRRKNGEVFPEHLSINAIRSDAGEVTNFIAVFSDIAERKRLDEQLSQLAYNDPLTGLPNRRLFFDRLDRTLSLTRRQGGLLAVVVLDLDGFKVANDSHGHNAGDFILKDSGRRLVGALRDSDTIARLGGDEFGVILPAVDTKKGARRAVERLLECFSRPFQIAGHSIEIGTSIGIALYPQDGRSGTDLVENADLAMYWVKNRGKHGVAFFGDLVTPCGPQRRVG